MKRKVTLVLLCVLLLSCAAFFTACGTKHTHSFTNYVPDNNATCTEDGTKTAKCDGCEETDTVADPGTAKGHDYVNGVCTVCGDVLAEATGLAYTLSEDGAYYIVSGLGEETRTQFAIPSAYNGLPVKEIGKGAFSGCRELTDVKIPDSVTSIGKWAFRNCDGLTNITIPDNVTYIGIEAFANSRNLVSLTIGNGVDFIDVCAFLNCSSLTDVTIGNGVTSFGYWVFSDCESLKFNEYENAYYLGNNTNKYLVLIKAVSKDITSCKINENCKVIHDTAFFECDRLKNLVIPDSVTCIGNHAFDGCRDLETVTIGNSVDLIDIDVFNDCSSLKSVTIGNAVTSIRYGAFANCISLTSVTIPDSVTSVGEVAFWGCSSLTSVTVGSGVTSIEDRAFSSCYKLVEVINNSSLNITKGDWFPGGIGSYALNVKKGGTSDVVNKGGYLFYTYENVNYLLGYWGTDTELTLPSDYNGESYEIYKYAFQDSCLTNITIPDSMTSIGAKVFYNCKRLISITIPESVISIEDKAFEGCSNLTSVTIPSSVKSIGEYMFSDCSKLININYTGTTLMWKLLTRGIEWNGSTSGRCVVHCIDGDVSL